MLGGFSSSKGILIYDSSFSTPNAVFGYYENDEIKIIKGNLDELKKNRHYKDQELNKDTSIITKIVLLVFVIYAIFLFYSLFNFSLHQFITRLFFCVTSYFPVLVLIIANINTYKDKHMFHQYRKYHACEHAAIYLISKKIEPTLEQLKKTPIFDDECGTVWCGNFLILSIITTYLIQQIFNFGVLKTVAIFIISVIVLILNFFNPYNPLKLFQVNVIEKPTNKEYLLGLELIKEFKKIKEKTNEN